MTKIEENIYNLKLKLPSDVRLVAVSKTKPAGDIIEAYNTGRDISEKTGFRNF